MQPRPDPDRTPPASRTVTIVNQRGLHARAAARFAALAGQFAAEVTVARNDAQVSALSLMGLLMLGASQGTEVTLTGSGADAETAVNALVGLVENRFGEDV